MRASKRTKRLLRKATLTLMVENWEMHYFATLPTCTSMRFAQCYKRSFYSIGKRSFIAPARYFALHHLLLHQLQFFFSWVLHSMVPTYENGLKPGVHFKQFEYFLVLAIHLVVCGQVLSCCTITVFCIFSRCWDLIACFILARNA